MKDILGWIIAGSIIAIIVFIYGSIIFAEFLSNFFEKDKPFLKNKKYYFKELLRLVVLLLCIGFFVWLGYGMLTEFLDTPPVENYSSGETYPF